MPYQEKAVYKDIIGTKTTPATLTAAYTGNRVVLNCDKLPQLHIDISYTPKTAQTNRYIYLLLEISQDGTNFVQKAVKVVSTTEIDIYRKDTDGNDGVPRIFPGDKQSTGGTTYTGTVDTEVYGSHIRVSIKESGSSNFGTINLDVNLNSK